VDGADAPSTSRPSSEGDETSVGLGLSVGFLWNEAAVASNEWTILGLQLHAQHGWLRLGVGGEARVGADPEHSLPPGETQVSRQNALASMSLGISVPGTAAGDGWLARHTKLDVLSEVGVSFTSVFEDVGAGGAGDREWHYRTPFVGAWLGLGYRERSDRWRSSLGVAAFYRHHLGAERVTTATGESVPVIGDQVGLVLTYGFGARVAGGR
jgi:hypothetical protein